MTFRGLEATVSFDSEDDQFVGRLVGITDIVGFHAENAAGLEAALREAVDDYLDTCRKTGNAAG